MVQAAFIRVQQASGVLAAVVVALADRLGAEARAPLRHFGIVHRHNDRGHTDLAANGMHRFVLFTDGQCNPLLPGYWTDVVLAFYFQAGGHVGGHHAERVLRRAHVDGLPVAIQHQHGRFRQYVHEFADNRRSLGGSDGVYMVFVLCWYRPIKLAATAGNAPALPVSETGVQTSTLSGKMVIREGDVRAIAE